MQEYILDVEQEGQLTTIKTFANSVEGVIDNVVDMKSVDKLFHIGNLETKQIWEFDEDIRSLRKLKEKIPNNIKMFFSVKD